MSTQTGHSMDLDRGHLSEPQVLGITIAGFIPAVGLATLPAFVASYAGLSSWLPMLAGTVMFVVIAFLIRVFARRFVSTGSLFSYIQEVMGPRAGVFMAASLIPGYVIAVSSLILGACTYFGSFLLSLGVQDAGNNAYQIGLVALITLITTVVVYRGIDVSVRASIILTAVSVPFILIITGAVLVNGGTDLGGQLSLDGFTLTGFLQGMALGATFYIGFESTAALAAETREPKKVIPRALLAVPLGLGTLYTIATFIQVPTLVERADDLAAGISPPLVLAESVGLGALGKVTDLIIAIAVFASLIAFTNYGARVMAAAAKQGLLPQRLLRVHPRYKSPTMAVFAVIVPAFLGPVALLLVSDTTPLELYGVIATLLVYAWVVPYVLVCLGAPLLLRREGRNWVPAMIIGVVVAAGVLWLYVNGILNPGPAPLSAMPYVMAALLVIFTVGFAIAWRRGGRSLEDIDL